MRFPVFADHLRRVGPRRSVLGVGQDQAQQPFDLGSTLRLILEVGFGELPQVTAARLSQGLGPSVDLPQEVLGNR